MTERKRLAALYRAAAKDIEDGFDLGSCVAITYRVSSAIAPCNCAEAQRYARIFADSMFMNGYGGMVAALPKEHQRGYRVTALCLAAAMVEAGDA
jgi:hypothetical protein